MTNNTTFPGTLTCPTSSVSNAMTMGTTKTYVVTVSNASGANKFYIDGYLQASLVLHQGQTYIFDLSSSTLSGHPFEFSTTDNGSHGGGSTYAPALPTSIKTTGTYASSQKRTFVVGTNTPTLYYYCTQHSGMGGYVGISPKAELIVSGGAEFIGTGTIKLPSGTTSERPSTGMTGMIRYNTTTGFIETYTAEGWGSIAPPPVITGISPTSVAGADTATQVITVTGTGFDTGLSIKLVGADDTEYSVFSTTRVSGQSATFKMGASGASGGYDVAQRPFKVKVIGGDTASAVTSTSTNSIALSAPSITGVSPTTFASSAVGSQTITVTGTNFTSSMASGNKIQVLGADGSTLYNVDSAAVASATSITFKLAASGGSLTTGQLDNRPYKVRVTDAVGITATSTQTIGFNGIAWSSPASGATLSYENGTSESQNLVATDDLGGTDVTFSITSGSVAGLSLGSTTASPATFSGSATTDGTTNVTFRVTDNESGTTADRTFSVVVSSTLYSFNNFTFTNAGATGATGPTLSQLRAAYSPTWTDYTSNLAIATQAGTSYGIQAWTVPETKQYTIEAFGAGGRLSAGARMKGTFSLTKGEIIRILVGQESLQMPSGYNKGGGGGTFVVRTPYSTTASILVIAGGGGGTPRTPQQLTSTNGSQYNSGNNAATAGPNGASPGGTSGGGGSHNNLNWSSGSGAGFSGNGVTSPGNQAHTRTIAYAFTGGGKGGTDNGSYPHGHGGFGGGGAASYGGGAGGGGYSGGGGLASTGSGTYSDYEGGGGGSYNSGTNQSNSSGGGPSGTNGYVIVTKL